MRKRFVAFWCSHCDGTPSKVDADRVLKHGYGGIPYHEHWWTFWQKNAERFRQCCLSRAAEAWLRAHKYEPLGEVEPDRSNLEALGITVEVADGCAYAPAWVCRVLNTSGDTDHQLALLRLMQRNERAVELFEVFSEIAPDRKDCRIVLNVLTSVIGPLPEVGPHEIPLERKRNAITTIIDDYVHNQSGMTTHDYSEQMRDAESTYHAPTVDPPVVLKRGAISGCRPFQKSTLDHEREAVLGRLSAGCWTVVR